MSTTEAVDRTGKTGAGEGGRAQRQTRARRSELIEPKRPMMLLVDDDLPPEMIRGVYQYVRNVVGWTIMWSPLAKMPADRLLSLEAWASAAVMSIHDEAIAGFARSASFPVVNVIESRWAMGIDTVSVDNRRCGALAFEHLRSLGLSWFGYLPWELGLDNNPRHEGFMDAARRAGMSERVVPVASALLRWDNWSEDIRHQAELFLQLPRPIGILCFADWTAALAVHSAAAAGISVPDEIAIIGIDDDETMCEGTNPTLSSVNTSNGRVGFEAAKLALRRASQRTAGEPRGGSETIRVAPVGVIERASTQVLAVEDADVAAALRYLRRRVDEGARPTVPEVANAVLVSRRGLDAKFMKHLGRTVADEAERLRLRNVLDLLGRTDLSAMEIATRTGFTTVAHMSRVVHKATGRPTMAYRQWVRMRGKG